MQFISEDLESYITHHSQEEPKYLKELSVETYKKVVQPRMLSGHLQGRMLSMISKFIAPTHVLDIGSYTGYSAICLAEGLVPNGKVHTIDINEELRDIQQKYFTKSGFGNQIISYTGDALKIIPTIPITFDLVFIDAEKSSYIDYFESVLEKINPRGVILSDNVLWSGKVLQDAAPNDRDTQTLITYNKLLKEHPRLETIMLPLRDGLTISRVLP